MASFFVDTLFSSLVMIVAFIIYKLLLSGEKQIAFNRMTLLAIYALSLLSLPLYGIDLGFPATSGDSQLIEIGTPIAGEVISDVRTAPAPSHIPEIIVGIYLTGAATVLLLNLISIIRLFRIIHSGIRIDRGDYTLVIVPYNKNMSPFSFGKYIVIGDVGIESTEDLITSHESAHINARHYIDLIIAQTVCVILWYNPVSWLMRDELRLIHEYQADAEVLASGVDPRDYQMLLIKRAVGNKFSFLANGFSQHKLKNRITMMQKEKSKGMRRLRAIALAISPVVALTVVNIPAVASGLEKLDSKPSDDGVKTEVSTIQSPEVSKNIVIEDSNAEISDSETPAAEDRMDNPATIDNIVTAEEAPSLEESSESPDDNKEVYVAVEKNADFPGGMQELMKFLMANIRYPKEAYDANEQGRVIVKFIVNEDGSISDAHVVRGVSKSLDDEAVRVVMSMPKWTPGQAGGKNVASYFTLPVNFRLQVAPPKEAKEENNGELRVVAHGN